MEKLKTTKSKFYEVKVQDWKTYYLVGFWIRKNKERAYISFTVKGNLLQDQNAIVKDSLYEIVKRGVRPSPLLLGELERSFKALYELKMNPIKDFCDAASQLLKESNAD